MIAPCARVKRLLGMTRSGSTSRQVPRPRHFGHAPAGLLKEKLLGSMAPRLILHFGQLKNNENISSIAPVSSAMTTLPFPRSKALSTARSKSCFCHFWRLPFSGTSSVSIRSSIVCFCSGFSFMEATSPRSYRMPFTRAFSYPARVISFKVFGSCPASSMNMGERI